MLGEGVVSFFSALSVLVFCVFLFGFVRDDRRSACFAHCLVSGGFSFGVMWGVWRGLWVL